MTMLKVVEVLAQSEKSWEDAPQLAVQEAAKTVRNIKSIYIQERSESACPTTELPCTRSAMSLALPRSW
ncbi:MAG: dodecin family protein [Gammaproteobacteria bacterium]